MSKGRFITFGLFFVFIMLFGMEVYAAPGGGWRQHPQEQKRPGYVLDNRHHHNRYYPRPGSGIKVLPRGYRVVPWHGTRYYFTSGSWYISAGGGFVVTTPPVGLLIPFLPSFYTTIWVGSVPYYYAGGVYYAWEPGQQAYRVIDSPPEKEVVEETSLPERLFIYPKQGQSEQQQATDRYQCHSWAKSQTGFDPTQPAGGVAEGMAPQARADYNRAMKACLEARGYSVQ